MSVGRPPIITSPGLSTRSITVCPGTEAPSTNVARRFSIARSLSSRSISPSALSPQPCVKPFAGKLAPFVPRLGRRALHFPARRPRHGAAAHDRDVVHVEAEQRADFAPNRLGQQA